MQLLCGILSKLKYKFCKLSKRKDDKLSNRWLIDILILVVEIGIINGEL